MREDALARHRDQVLADVRVDGRRDRVDGRRAGFEGGQYLRLALRAMCHVLVNQRRWIVDYVSVRGIGDDGIQLQQAIE